MKLKNLIPLLALLAACSVVQAGTLTGNGAGGPSGGNSPTQPSSSLPGSTLPIASNTGAPQPSRAAASTVAAPLVLNVLSPLNNDIVGEAQIKLTGSVSRQTVLSVNNDIYILPAGKFSIPVSLEEGPNSLEIVASDSDGNETDLILVVTYQP
jgi:hypothetical protein